MRCVSSTDESLRLLADQSLGQRSVPGTVIYICLYALQVFATGYHELHPVLVGWVGALLLIIGVGRLSLVFLFKRWYPSHDRSWRLLFTSGTLLVGAVWGGFWSLAISLDGLISTNMLGLMATIGIAAGGMATLAPNRRLVLSYLALMFLPTATATLFVGTAEGYLIAFMMVCGSGFLASVGMRLNREYWRGLRNMALLDRRAKELAVARDAAVAGDRAKSEFLARMSHEIRTPLNGVLGMTELLLTTRLTEKQHHYADLVQRSARSLLSVINDVLDFSKIEAGKLEFETIDFDLRETLEEITELWAEPAQRKGLELTCLIPEWVPTQLVGDPARLRQVLANLIANALKFTQHGEIAIRATAEQIEEARVGLRFEVEDTGIGIASDAQQHIFESFSQADGSTTRRYGGTGLGLAIARQLSEMMGGRIGVESELGRGSTFWFTASVGRARASEQSGEPLMQTIPKLHVLVVDDNATSRDVLHHMLEGWGLRHTCTATGPEALDMLARAAIQGDPFDVALVDRVMPGMDGMDLVRAVRCVAELADLRLILLSTMVPQGESEDAESLRIERHLHKPVRRACLLDCLINQDNQPVRVTGAGPGTAEPANGATPIQPLTVLLAEDNPVNQELAVAMLEAIGCRVDVAGNGKQALAAVSTVRYDAVFMDCQMPEMDGLEATRRIRRREAVVDLSFGVSPAPARIPIIALTAHAMQGDRARCLAAGMDDYLTKPFRQDELAAVLSRWTSTAAQPLRSAPVTAEYRG